MKQLEGFDALTAPDLADEGADPAEPRMGIGEHSD
jgi:hypothetical protein